MRKKGALPLAQETLYRDVRAVLESARSSAYRAVNTAMVRAYWQVGRLIVEHEQRSRKRAAYGLAVLDDLSRRLTADFGKGFTTTNLRYMRSFYQAFSIHHALRDESRSADNVNAPRSELAEVRPRGETLWLSSNQIATLFGSATARRPAAGGHR
jgi:hypothetical protein